MQINELLCIIHKLIKVVYEKTAYEDTIFISKNLWINIKAYLFALAIFHKLKNKPIQTGPRSTWENNFQLGGSKLYNT